MSIRNRALNFLLHSLSNKQRVGSGHPNAWWRTVLKGNRLCPAIVEWSLYSNEIFRTLVWQFTTYWHTIKVNTQSSHTKHKLAAILNFTICPQN